MKSRKKRKWAWRRIRKMKTAGGDNATFHSDFGVDVNKNTEFKVDQSLISEIPEHFNCANVYLDISGDDVGIDLEQVRINNHRYQFDHKRKYVSAPNNGYFKLPN